MFKQPRGFSACFTSELSDRLAFYGLISCIIILLTNTFGKSSSFGYQFYGELTGLGFISPVVGGILADRFYHRLPSVIIGLVFILLGNLLIIPMHFQWLLLGISCIVVGIGLMKPNDVALVGTLYPDFSVAKEKGITLFYLGMNTGAILGPFILGIAFYFTHEYRIFFMFTAVMLLVALSLFYRHYAHFKKITTTQPETRPRVLKTPLFLLVVLALIALVYLLLRRIEIFNTVFVLTLILVAMYLLYLLYRSVKAERINIFFVLILCFFSIAYFASSMQTSGALVVFSQLYSNQYLKMQLPVEWVASIEPLAVILVSPFVIRYTEKRLGAHMDTTFMLWKIAIALLATSLAYFCFYAMAWFLRPGFVLSMIVLGNILIGLGELLITTTIFSTISNFIGNKHRGFFMSLYMLSIAISSYLGSMLAAGVVGTQGRSNLNDYPHLFLSFACITLVVALIFVLIMPRVRAWLKLEKL